jgi:hypothetical protein
LAQSLHPAEKDVFQYHFFDATQNILDRKKKCFSIGEFISSQELLYMTEKIKSDGANLVNMADTELFSSPALDTISCDLCSVRTRVIGVRDEVSIPPSDLSAAPN